MLTRLWRLQFWLGYCGFNVDLAMVASMLTRLWRIPRFSVWRIFFRMASRDMDASFGLRTRISNHLHNAELNIETTKFGNWFCSSLSYCPFSFVFFLPRPQPWSKSQYLIPFFGFLASKKSYLSPKLIGIITLVQRYVTILWAATGRCAWYTGMQTLQSSVK